MKKNLFTVVLGHSQIHLLYINKSLFSVLFLLIKKVPVYMTAYKNRFEQFDK